MRLQMWSTALIIALGLACHDASRAVAQDLDSVKADASHHKVEFENEQVRVVRYKIAPGDTTANHSHPNNVNIALTDVNAKFTTPDGKTNEVHGKAGAVAWRSATTHVVQNTRQADRRHLGGTEEAIIGDARRSIGRINRGSQACQSGI